MAEMKTQEGGQLSIFEENGAVFVRIRDATAQAVAKLTTTEATTLSRLILHEAGFIEGGPSRDRAKP